MAAALGFRMGPKSNRQSCKVAYSIVVSLLTVPLSHEKGLKTVLPGRVADLPGRVADLPGRVADFTTNINWPYDGRSKNEKIEKHFRIIKKTGHYYVYIRHQIINKSKLYR